MADLARPALPEVLAVLTGTDELRWVLTPLALSADGVSRPLYAIPEPQPWSIVRPWLHTTPAEAQEALSADGVLPQGWCDDPRRGWHDRTAADDGWGDWEDVVLPAPRTIPDLVAVTSLGWPAIQAAEELARDACRELAQYGCPTPDRVVWRVGSFRRYDTVWSRDVRKTETMVLVRDGRFDAPDGFSRVIRRIILPAEAIWASGLALDRITPEAVVVVVPPVGGVR